MKKQSSLWFVIAFTTMALVACGGGGGGGGIADADSDGIADANDNCVNTANADQADADGDGEGDACDALTDSDSDGVADATDNCLADANADQLDSDLNGQGNACDAITSTYTFESGLTVGESSVSYTGQTARQLLISDLVSTLAGLTERVGEEAVIDAELDFYIRGDVDSSNYAFSLAGETVTPGPTFGDISSGKNLANKIAGGNGTGGGESALLIDSDFFGWSDGLDADPLPIELVDLFIDRVAAEASDGANFSINTTAGPANVDTVVVDEQGRNYRQLIQKFLLGAVAFSQGTADYLQTDFLAKNEQEGDKAFTGGEHDWDEAFGYFGAARNYNDYTDLEIRAKSGRPEFENGYNDANGDGMIDIRSEFNFGNSTNCAKRDVGATVATDFTKTVFDAFLLGRQIINNGVGSTFTQEQLDAVRAQGLIASSTWEKCIAATVVHYINDIAGDLSGTVAGNFADTDSFLSLAKHWSEMKGFTLGLQFNPDSPFRNGEVTGIDVNSLKMILMAMGNAPVLADGSQQGVAPTGTAQEAIDAYVSGLMAARDTLQTAYAFEADNVANW